MENIKFCENPSRNKPHIKSENNLSHLLQLKTPLNKSRNSKILFKNKLFWSKFMTKKAITNKQCKYFVLIFNNIYSMQEKAADCSL